jgi:hypothetical protein
MYKYEVKDTKEQLEFRKPTLGEAGKLLDVIVKGSGLLEGCHKLLTKTAKEQETYLKTAEVYPYIISDMAMQLMSDTKYIAAPGEVDPLAE